MKTNDLGNKPFGTKIQLTKSGNFFEIYIPPMGFHPVLLFIAPFAIAWNSFITVWTLMAAQVPFPGNIFLMMFSLPFWVVGGCLAYACLFTLCGKTYLRIDSQEIYLIKTLFDRKVSRERPEPRQEITQLIFTREHFDRDSDGDRVSKPATMKIELGVKSIQLGGMQGGIEHESEMEWLAFEVSEWLDKPLKIIESPEID
ncbi:hypothetical protein [Chamaesiphon sp. VAR_69_metabat_338]|uniref:hypothetical protein n=1 Tax=Chamaesiphon sp. VAR_69_metabat_338 TaxID=2964704 RepID=UPI00286DD34A|nr:hypothetical protein [Chamaesiphon sp. VAR_69_metabat_338]